MFLFNLWWKPNANDLSLLIITLYLSHQEIMLFSVPKLDANSFMFLPVISILVSVISILVSVISILVSPPKCVNLTDVLLLILMSTSLIYIRNNNNNGPVMHCCRTHYWIILSSDCLYWISLVVVPR
jgi:hypothetical protein